MQPWWVSTLIEEGWLSTAGFFFFFFIKVQPNLTGIEISRTVRSKNIYLKPCSNTLCWARFNCTDAEIIWSPTQTAQWWEVRRVRSSANLWANTRPFLVIMMMMMMMWCLRHTSTNPSSRVSFRAGLSLKCEFKAQYSEPWPNKCWRTHM